MKTADKRIELQSLFDRLTKLVEAEGGENWLPGLQAVLERLVITETYGASLERRLQEIKSIFVTMNRGQESFADFYVWRDDFDARLSANAELKNLRNNIWELLQDVPAL